MNMNGNAYDAGGQAYQNAWGSVRGAHAPRTGNLMGSRGVQTIAGSGNTADQIPTYMSPYTDQVINRAQNDYARQNEILLNQNAANAVQGGSFGGARHGLVDAMTNAETARGMGDLSAQMRDRGWNTAANLAAGHVDQDMRRGESLLDARQQNIDNKFRRADMRNRTGQQAFNNWMNAGDTAFRQGDAAVAAQSAAGNQVQNQNQALMDAAAAIFDGNDPQSVLANLQAALSGSPLAMNSSQTTQRNASGAEKVGTIFKIAQEAGKLFTGAPV